MLQFLLAGLLLLAAFFAYKLLIANDLFGPFVPYTRPVLLVFVFVLGISALGCLSLLTGLSVLELRRKLLVLRGWPRVIWVVGLVVFSVVFACAFVGVYFLVMIA